MVPANRWGHGAYSAAELKILQEAITLTVFGGFAVTYLGEDLRWNHLAAFACLLAAVAFAFLPKADRPPPTKTKRPAPRAWDGLVLLVILTG